MVQFGFNAQEHEPSKALEPLPNGWYDASIEKSEIKPTKDQSGAYIQLVYNILTGDHSGRKVFHNLNVQNQNPQAVEIANKELSAICYSTGVMNVSDTSQLHNIPHRIKIAIVQGQNGPQNSVKGFRDQNDNEPGEGGAVQGNQAPAQEQANWNNNQATQETAPPSAPNNNNNEGEVVLTAKANGASMQSFLDNGWTVDQMIEQGYAERVTPTAPDTPAAPPSAPETPAAPPAAASGDQAGQWTQQPAQTGQAPWNK